MQQPTISDPQQDVLAEVVLVVNAVLGTNENSQLPGMDAVRAKMLAGNINLTSLEKHLRTTGWNESPPSHLEKLARISAGEVVLLTDNELTNILALPNQDVPPCFNYCHDLDSPEIFIGWAGSYPNGQINLFGRIIVTSENEI